MAMKRHERTTARRVALQVLYTAEIKGITTAEVVAEGTFPSEEGTLTDYALDLVRGVENNRIAIDGNLKAAAENWSLGRMPIVDRSILRIATYEILFVEDVPTSVAINEAVELAKDFGGEDESPRFVNGVLGRIARQLEEDAKDPEAARRREEEALAAYAFPTNEEDSAAEFAGEQPAAEGAVENAPAAEGEDTSADAVSPEEPACAAEEPTRAPEEPVNVGL